MGAMFFYEVKGHMQKINSTDLDESKRVWPKKSIRLVMQVPLHYFVSSILNFSLFEMVCNSCSTIQAFHVTAFSNKITCNIDGLRIYGSKNSDFV